MLHLWHFEPTMFQEAPTAVRLPPGRSFQYRLHVLRSLKRRAVVVMFVGPAIPPDELI
ncbi:MAG: hypothetical protein OEM15_15420 [Myxococcales bacterium]|nr:hypothetical protein [Myxococcales bacterium]